MDEGSTPSPYDALRFELMELRRRSGNPTYRHLATAGMAAAGVTATGTAAAGRQLQLPLTPFSASTIADNLNGRRRSMSQEFVRFFVHSCWASARRKGFALPAGDLSWSRWYGLWRAQAPAWEFGPGGAAGAAGAAGPAGAGPAGQAGHAPGREHRRPPGRHAVSPGRVLAPGVGGPAGGRQDRTSDSSVGHRYADRPQPCSSDWGGPMESPVIPARRAAGRPAVADAVPEPGWLQHVLRLCAEVIDADPLLSARVRAASGTDRTASSRRGRSGPGSGRPGPQAPSGRTRGAGR